MKLIILGAKGMLGKALKEEFEKNVQVFAFDKNELDVTNKIELKAKIENLRPEFVINATAYNAVDEIEANASDYRLAEMINGYAVGHIAEICNHFNIPLVHYSSDYVFKGANESGYDEDAYIDPVNKYGETKALGEKLLKSSTAKYYLIRLSRLFGSAGESETAKKSFVDIMLDLALKQGRTQLDLVNDEKTCPTYSVDLARFTKQLVDSCLRRNNNSNLPFGIYHGANSGACTWYEFAQEIFKLKNLSIKCNPVPATHFPRPAKRPSFSELLNTKMPKQRNWKEALAEYLK